MGIVDKAKQAAIAATVTKALDYLEKDPETNIPKIMEMVDKVTPDGWYAGQRNAIRHSIGAKDNWYQLILRMYQLDAGVRRRAALTVQIEERNKALLDAEIQHIEKWAEDQQLTLENELKDIKAKIKEKKRLLSRSENAQQTLTLEKELNTLTRQQKRKRAEIFDLEDEIEEKRDGMIDKVKAFIKQHITEEELFCVHWALKK